MISPLAHIDPSAKLGKDVTVYPFAFIDGNVEIGDGCVIMPYVSIMNGSRIGKNNKIYQGTIIGADPQDFRWKGEQTYCTIGNNNVIREHVIINRGIKSTGGTFIGDDSFIMAEAHIGHDSRIEGTCVLGNGATVAGDCRIEECSIMSSNAVLHEHSHVGKWVLIKGGCRIAGNVPPYVIMAHNPVAYTGVNSTILLRHGNFTQAQVDDIAAAYRHIYQSGSSVFNGLKRIEADIAPSEIRSEIENFISSHDLNIVATTTELE
jgi:UDP-N-acetylglucosamine acyltransferase